MGTVLPAYLFCCGFVCFCVRCSCVKIDMVCHILPVKFREYPQVSLVALNLVSFCLHQLSWAMSIQGFYWLCFPSLHRSTGVTVTLYHLWPYVGSRCLNLGTLIGAASIYSSWPFPSICVYQLDTFLIQLDISQGHWEKETSTEQRPLSDWSMHKSGHFPGKWLIRKGPSHWRQCHTWAGVLGCIGKQTEEAMGIQQVRSVPHWSLLQFWFPGTCLRAHSIFPSSWTVNYKNLVSWN